MIYSDLGNLVKGAAVLKTFSSTAEEKQYQKNGEFICPSIISTFKSETVIIHRYEKIYFFLIIIASCISSANAQPVMNTENCGCLFS